MTEEREDHVAIADEMKRTGGGFISALAAAIIRADDDNLDRIKRAFPEYWLVYKTRAAIRREKQRGEE